MLIKILNSIRLRDLFLGFKKGYNIPTLPHKLENLYSNIYIRIFRVIGGLCLLLVLTSNYSLFPVYLHTLIKIIGFIQSIQIVIIFTIKAIYASYTLIYNSKDFEVRYSPLNYYASHLARAILCVKVGCVVTGGTASVIAAGASYDQVLEAAGRVKVFIPILGSMYESVFAATPPSPLGLQRGGFAPQLTLRIVGLAAFCFARRKEKEARVSPPFGSFGWGEPKGFFNTSSAQCAASLSSSAASQQGNQGRPALLSFFLQSGQGVGEASTYAVGLPCSARQREGVLFSQ